MKNRQVAVIAVLIIFIAGWPFGALALDDSAKQGLEGSDVICIVEEIYDFSVPDNAEITFPNTSEYLGDFVIGNILLKSNETLRLNINIGMLSKTDDNNSVITYDVIFNAPGEIDKTKIGSAYSIGVLINSKEFKNADAGTYRAPLRFQVVSNSSNEVVWEQTVLISAIKPIEQEQQQNSNNNETDTISTNEDHNDTAVVEEKSEISLGEEDTATHEEDGDTEQDGLFLITDNDVPTGQFSINDSTLLWIAIACGAVILFILIYFFISRRAKDNSKSN